MMTTLTPKQRERIPYLVANDSTELRDVDQLVADRTIFIVPLEEHLREFGEEYDWDKDPLGARQNSVFVLFPDEDGIATTGVVVMASGLGAP